jgi:hypothetical protein
VTGRKSEGRRTDGRRKSEIRRANNHEWTLINTNYHEGNNGPGEPVETMNFSNRGQPPPSTDVAFASEFVSNSCLLVVLLTDGEGKSTLTWFDAGFYLWWSDQSVGTLK